MGGLRLRVFGTLGHPCLWPRVNDTGFDTANHAHDGIVVMGPCMAHSAPQASLYDIAPSVLRYFGLPIPTSMQGRNLLG
jgi:predicted AlkP superfamily phosphohydrolase/phosphomutase